jgi:hypothetical protein
LPLLGLLAIIIGLSLKHLFFLAMPDKITWENTLDNTYRCYVLMQTDTYGYLRMERLDSGERVLDQEVPVSKYFREQDVLSWGDVCMRRAKELED